MVAAARNDWQHLAIGCDRCFVICHPLGTVVKFVIKFDRQRELLKNLDQERLLHQDIDSPFFFSSPGQVSPSPYPLPRPGQHLQRLLLHRQELGDPACAPKGVWERRTL